MSKVFEWHQEQEKLNGKHIEPTEEDMEPTDGELTEIEWELENVIDTLNNIDTKINEVRASRSSAEQWIQ